MSSHQEQSMGEKKLAKLHEKNTVNKLNRLTLKFSEI